MSNNVDILRLLLEQEEESGAPETFEENPMEFILNKYVSLNQIMTELMTKDYREYLEAVYIISPKPTSFKVVLHNGQYFYLTYMGPAYEATVAGKNYYLSGVGERERCMIAISKLLRGGNPLKTKGPEGAEKEAAAEEEGGEGGISAGETGEAEGGESEGGGGETEELTESANLLLKLLLEEELKSQDTKPEVKKKTTIPKTPIIQRGSLSPQKLLSTNKAYGKGNLVAEIKNAIESIITGSDNDQVESTKKFLVSLVDDVANIKSTYQDVSELADDSVSIDFSKNTIDALALVNRKDLNTIGIEFGEILGAIYVSRRILKVGKKIVFPSESNNPMTDFVIDNINVSSKYKKGAASSLRDVIEENEKFESSIEDEKEKQLYDVLKESFDYGASMSYLYIAKNIDDADVNMAFDELKKLGIDLKNKPLEDSEGIKDYINEKILQLKKTYGPKASSILDEFYGKIGRKRVSQGGIKWDDLKGNYYGLITSPIAYYLASKMNDSYKKELKSLVQRTEIKQLRLNFSLKEKTARFSMQSFKSPYASFVFLPGKISANDPEKGFMAFRME